MFLFEFVRPLPSYVIGATRGEHDARKRRQKDPLPLVQAILRLNSATSSLKAIQEDSEEMEGLPELGYYDDADATVTIAATGISEWSTTKLRTDHASFMILTTAIPDCSESMSSTPLSDGEISEWLRAVGFPCANDLRRINTSIEIHQARLREIERLGEGVFNPMTQRGKDGEPMETRGLHIPLIRRRKRLTSGSLPPEKVKELTVSKDNSVTSLKRLRSLISPVRRLPLELLQEIFRQCLPQQKFMKPDPLHAPILLTHVCGAWRDVSISCPFLWTSLELTAEKNTFERHPEYSQRNATALLNMWFSRSGNYPLSLYYDDGADVVPFNIANTLQRLSSRWRNLKIYLPEHNYFSLPSCDYPSLESFELWTPCGIDTTLANQLSSAMIRAPNLRRFIWSNSVLLYPAPIDLCWGSLTRLTLNTSINVDQCLTIMSLTQKVTHLTIHIALSTTNRSDLNIVLPELKSFVVYADYSARYIFEEITSPKLEELVLNIKTWPHTSIKGFLRRSRCPIESLNIYFAPIDEGELIEILELVQNTLKELTVQSDARRRSMSDTILDRLTDKGIGDVLCPKVVVIALYGCLSCSTASFIEMVRSRVNPPLRIRPDDLTVDAHAPRPLTAQLRVVEMYEDEAAQLELKPLRSQGLILKIYSREDCSPVEMDEEEAERLRSLRLNGLVLRAYSPTTGHFGELDID